MSRPTWSLTLNESYLLGATNARSSEDDALLAARIAADPNAVGFFGYAYYQANQDALRIVPVDGVTPNATTVEDGSYPLARPLYIYTTAEILAGNPAVREYVGYALENLAATVT